MPKGLFKILILLTFVACDQGSQSNGDSLIKSNNPAYTGPTSLSISIDSGETYTTNTSQSLTLNAIDVTQMYISLSGCGVGSTWEAFNTTYAVTLNANQTNEIYFKARNDQMESECESVSIIHDTLPPEAPSLVTLGNDASDIATDTSSWSIPSDNGDSGISDYEYAVSTTNDETGIIAGASWTSTLGATEFQITSGVSLSAGVDYYTLIRAIDSAGNTGSFVASSAWQITVSPEMVTNLEATNITTENISLGWSYPNDNGTAITDYEIMIQGGGYTSWTLLNDGISTATSSNVAGLDPETAYDLKIRAFNGVNYSAWSNTLSVETLPNIEFFEPGFKAINISGAPKSKLVSMEDNNNIYLNGSLITTLNKHDTHQFDSSEFDKIEGTGAFFVAGKLGTGTGSQDQGNATWATQSWVGKNFYFNFTRMAPLRVKVYAFTASDISITQNGSPIASTSLAAGAGHNFSIANEGAYEMTSTGFIVAFSYGNQGGEFYDPVPILPASTDIIGVPSSKATISSSTNGNNYSYRHSDSNNGAGTLNLNQVLSINERASADGSSLYRGHALRVIASNPIVAVSNADSTGYCQAPFVPTSMMQKKFALNEQSVYVAFVSDRPVTVTITQPDGTVTTKDLVRTGSNAKDPYKAYLNNSYPAGTLFEGSDKFQAYYETITGTYSAGDDETIMFGWP
jgi:hypothetical protein